MYNIFWKRSLNMPLPSVMLDGVWRVDADLTYHIRPAKDWPDRSLVAIRTEKGQGVLVDTSGTRRTLQKDSLIFLYPRQVTEYWSEQAPWKFYWFEFRCDTPLPLETDRFYSIPFSASEKAQIQECYLNLGSTGEPIHLLSQAIFCRLLFGWLAASPDIGQSSRQDLVAILEKGGKKGLSIPQIARQAGMCQRSFRSEIRRLTGYSPTEYLTKIKMETAMEMLCSTDKTVQEISDSLNFGNSFYFSRVFSQYYGIPPGKARSGFSSR